MPQLHLITPEGQEFAFNLETESVIIGRSEDNAICVPDGSISGQHARFIWNEDSYLLEDLDSTNGTRINGVKIEGPARLTPGDTIEFGSVRATYAPELVAAPEYYEPSEEMAPPPSSMVDAPVAIGTPVSKAFGPRKKEKDPLGSTAMLIGIFSLVASALLALISFTLKAG
jgi:hypothetical protein